MGGSIHNNVRPIVVQQTQNRMWRVWLLGQPASHALDIERNTLGTVYYVRDVVEGFTADLWCDLMNGEGVFTDFTQALSFCRLQLQCRTAHCYQEIRVRLLLDGEQKPYEALAGWQYNAIKHFFADIGYDVDAVEIGG